MLLATPCLAEENGTYSSIYFGSYDSSIRIVSGNTLPVVQVKRVLCDTLILNLPNSVFAICLTIPSSRKVATVSGKSLKGTAYKSDI